MSEIKNNKELSIIIVTFNSSSVIFDCLKSFNSNNYNIFVVDNASDDNTLEIVKNNFPTVKIIANSKNLGFGRANNMALKQIETPFALILNPDTLIFDDDIEIALNNLKNNPQIALASPLTVGSKEEFDIQKKLLKKSINYVDFIVGGITFMNIENVKKFGFFNEKYFLFAEDSEISDNSIKNGFKNAIFQDALVIHFGAKSSAKNLKNTYRRFWHLGWSKSEYKKGRKNKFNFIRSTLRLSIFYFCEGIFYFLRNNKEKSISKFAFCFGCFANLIGLNAFDKNDNPRGNLDFFNKINSQK